MIEKQPVILFDGVCNLCESSVQFLLKHDKKKLFRFGSLQSPAGIFLLEKFPQAKNSDSVVLIYNGKAYTKSSAALKIANLLGGWFTLFWPFSLLPAFFRDSIYSFIAARRYKWFGKKNECWLPGPQYQGRFID
ncbi:MAG: thiol-disulfide oxidoreductase DCC family protein [Flavitalea sp.]